MKNPRRINLSTVEESLAAGWVAQARDDDGHLMSCSGLDVQDETLAEWINECLSEGWTVTFYPSTGA